MRDRRAVRVATGLEPSELRVTNGGLKMGRTLWVSVVILVVALAHSAASAQSGDPDEPGLGKVLPPETGLYLGQTTFGEGEVSLLEQAIGRKVPIILDPALVSGQEEAGEGELSFNIEEAREYWERGYVVAVAAYEAYPGHSPFTVDKLIRGDYDEELGELAAQFRAFGKPMFFMTAREPNGVLSPYYGGFGPEGDKSFDWAFDQKKGFAEFTPPAGPEGNPDLFEGLGENDQNDGIERLAAAQRYYYDFFVRREGLTFLTFESMGWVVGPPIEVVGPPDPAEEHERALLAKARFWDLYDLIKDHCDWVSINWYVDTHPEEEPGEPPPVVRPIADFIESMDAFLTELEQVAPGKPVLLTELGFPPPQADEKMAQGMELFLSHGNVKGAVFWVDMDIMSQVRPGEPEAAVLRDMVENSPESFPSTASCFDGEPSTLRIHPEADTEIRSGAYADDNYGASTAPYVREREPGTCNRAVLRFDLSTLDSTVTDAKLRLYVHSVGSADTSHRLYFMADDSWAESTITWSNCPAATSTSTTWSVGTADAGIWKDVDVTGLVQQEAAGDDMLSLMVMADVVQNVSVQYRSKEYSGADYAPHLVVTVPGDTPPGAGIQSWSVAADHGPAGSIDSVAPEGYVESRAEGVSGIRVAFTAAMDPTTVDMDSLSVEGEVGGDQAGLIQSTALEAADTILVVSLSAPLADADRYTLTLSESVTAADGGAVSGNLVHHISTLVGDADGNGVVSLADILAVRATVTGQPLEAATARFDVNCSGGVTGADILAVRRRLGNQLP